MCHARKQKLEEDNVASVITGTPYLSATPTGYAGDPEHPVYMPPKEEQDRRYGMHYEDGTWIKAASIRAQTNHGTEQSYIRGCRCRVCHAYTAARLRGRPSTVTYGPEGRTYDVACPVHGSTHCHHLFDEAPSKPAFPPEMEDQVAGLIEVSRLPEAEVRDILAKAWEDTQPAKKPVRQERDAREKRVALHTARTFAANISWTLALAGFLVLIVGLSTTSTTLCGIGFGGEVTSLLAASFLGPPKLWKPKMDWRDKLGLEPGLFGVGQILATLGVGLLVLLLIAMICGSLYCFAMAAYTSMYGPSNWPF
jgi:hypothetical protein